MKNIHALCDKIIELDKKKTDQEWFATASTIETKVTGDYLAELYGGNEYEDGQFIAHTANHAAKLARALKEAISTLKYIEENCVRDDSTAWSHASCALEEIEEIFK